MLFRSNAQFEFRSNAKIINLVDPLKVLDKAILKINTISGTIVGATGHRTIFVELAQGQMKWWQPINIEIEQIITLAIKECYLEPKERRSSIDVVSFIKAKMLEQDINVNQCPSLRTIQRRIKQLDPYLVLRAKKGTRIANTTFKAAGIKKESQFVMAIVEIDTHYLDIFIIDEESKEVMGRPFLTCAIDIFTRCIVGWYLSMLPVNASSTLATIKDMLDRPHQGLPGGIPSLIIPDNGVEFKNNTMSKICCELGITIQPAQNRTPDDKAKIERFFGTITHNLIQKIKGTTFSNPREKADYEPYRVCRRVNILRDYSDEKTKLYPRN